MGDFGLVEGMSFSNPKRISIVHDRAVWNVNDEEYSHLEFIILGAVIQRRMRSWSSLECQSRNGADGYPTGEFPTGESNFPPEDVVVGQPLSCSVCIFKDWKTDATRARGGGRVHPRCVPQIAVPVMLTRLGGRAVMLPGVATLQRSAEPPTRKYIQTFGGMGVPTYVKSTVAKLNLNLAGAGDRAFKYSVPTYDAGSSVPREMYPILSGLYRQAREYLMKPPAPPAPRRAGGMLSVDPTPGATGTHSGGFFS